MGRLKSVTCLWAEEREGVAMANTPKRTFRSPGRIWNLAVRKSKRTGKPIAHVLNECLWVWTKDEREKRRDSSTE